MIELRKETTKNKEFIQSFEVTNGETSGDLLSHRINNGKLKVGLLATSYFEYYRMYEGIEAKVKRNMQKIADVLSSLCELCYPGVIDTLDKSNEAGEIFKMEAVDAIIIAEGTYSVDYLVHQALLHLPTDIPLLLFASQEHNTINYDEGYAGSLLSSGPMGIVQFACSLHKMQRNITYEAVAGAIEDPEVVEDIARFIKVREAIRNLRLMNIGLIGHIFRGMYDFQYDKTDVTGRLGPHIMDLDIKHLKNIFDGITAQDQRVCDMIDRAKRKYEISTEIQKSDMEKAARLGVALSQLIEQYKLNGLALLGQHFIEVEAETTSYLGIADILQSDQAVIVTEGDVLNLIVSIAIKEVTGYVPFFGEWEEIDKQLNAVMLLGHGFIDPRITRKDRPIVLGCSCEDWGWQGHAPGFEATIVPGPVTIASIISHNGKWKLLISEGQVPDTPPLHINESTVIIKVDEPVRSYYKKVIEYGFSHHALAVPGHISKELELFAKQLGIEVCIP